MHIVSVQRGDTRELDLGPRTIKTGIHKEPVDAIEVTRQGVSDDSVVNEEHHGGADQAVYVYSAADYGWWEGELGRSLTPGTFGENLTISAAPAVIRVGDRLRIGAVLLEVTAPRIPCSTFKARMAEPDWIRRFRDAGRPGFYCRVLEDGTVQPGDPVEWQAATDDNVTIDEMINHVYARVIDDREIRRALASPIAERSRAHYEEGLPAG